MGVHPLFNDDKHGWMNVSAVLCFAYGVELRIEFGENVIVNLDGWGDEERTRSSVRVLQLIYEGHRPQILPQSLQEGSGGDGLMLNGSVCEWGGLVENLEMVWCWIGHWSAPSGLQGGMCSWFMCWHWQYILCLLVYLASSSYFLFLLIFLTDLLPYLPFPLRSVVRWLDHLDAMCSRAWRALCAVGSRFNSSRGLGKVRPPT